jgi:hypothetical protein
LVSAAAGTGMKWRTTGTLFESRFKLMCERIEALKEI